MMWTEGDKEEPSGRGVGQKMETDRFNGPDGQATINEQPQRDYCRAYDVCLRIICTALCCWINYGGASTVIYRYFRRGKKKGRRVDGRTLTDGIVNVLGDRCGVRPVVGHRRSRPSGYHSSSTATTADTSLCRPAAQRIRPWPDTEARHTAPRCENRGRREWRKQGTRDTPTDRVVPAERKQHDARRIEHNGRRPVSSSPANRSDPNIALLSDWRGGALTVGGQRTGGEGKKTH